jgi:predicted Zn-dependent protease
MELGKQLDTQMLSQVQLLDDPVVTGYLEELAARIGRSSDVQVPVILRVVASSQPDSFSLPGGYVYITVGMVQETRTESELAAVLSHEVAHIACRHATRQMTRNQMMGLLSIPLMFVSGPIGVAVGETLSLAYPFTMLKFSRNAESEADAVGLVYLHASGYDPTAAISLFERVASQDHARMPGLRRLFSTHPITRDRLAAASLAIQKLPARQEYVVSTSRYEETVGRLFRLGYTHDPGIPALIRRTRTADTEP